MGETIGLMVQWFSGFPYGENHWFNGLMVYWFNGLMVYWFNGSLDFHMGKTLGLMV